jgi:hypothetical protein
MNGKTQARRTWMKQEKQAKNNSRRAHASCPPVIFPLDRGPPVQIAIAAGRYDDRHINMIKSSVTS